MKGIKALAQFVVWIAWESRRCNHEPGPWHMRELGMGKARHCVKCGKCLELI